MMLRRKIPQLGIETENAPCGVVAITCALFFGFHKDYFQVDLKVKEDGYCKLADMNESIRRLFDVNHYVYFRKVERKTLQDLSDRFRDRKAIVCVEGHYIFVDNNYYYSYFDNENDKVVAIWFLGEVK